MNGPLAENTYTKVQHWEGETLSVQCPYKNRKNHLEGKVWCRVRRKKCEAGFTRVWAQEPHYLLQDDAQAKVVTITMAALRPQDSGRYWCMRNSSRTLYPLMGILLEVFPAPTTERNTPLTHLSNILKGGMVLATGRTPTSGSDAPFNTSMTLFTAGLLTVASILPSTAPGTIGPTPMVGHSFTGTTPTTTGGRTTMGSQTVTESPSSAQTSSVGQVPISTKSVPPSTRLPTTGTCHTRKALLNKLPPIRHQDSDPTVLAVVLALLPVPVLLVIFYGLWKRRHTGSEYSPPPSQSAGPWGFTYFLRRLPALCL
nr:trem-like transcript 2 protein isoform X4 [Loxodonta africana]XP_023401706.1 trem-like transcript 2 protein isoform X4 [Loxodonta africana]